MKKVIIIGAGPAGLTAAYELLKDNSGEYEVTILEETDAIGGISKTVNYKGNRMDMGGHRFFSKIPEVNRWWNDMLPMQGAPSYDDILLKRRTRLEKGGPDPEKVNRAMLTRHRISRILFNDKFYDYPVSLKPETIKNFGFFTTMKVGFSYLGAVIHKRPENNLENFYINCFGKQLYSMFFEYYTENLWGRHPSEIDASWGAQRTKGLSITGIIKDFFGKVFKVKNRKVNTSLIEEFKYPKLGPGQLWEVTADEIKKLGGTIIMNAGVKKLHKNESNILTGVTYIKDGQEIQLSGDYIISSMPVKDLVAGMNDVPAEPARIASGLPYRDYMTLGVLVPKLNLQNKTSFKTVGNIVPDCWVYVQDRRVKMGRFQIYNNWSPYMVEKPEDTVWIGLEYFCAEGDDFWNMSEEDCVKFATAELVKMGVISENEVLDSHREKVKKAYPAYFDTYKHFDTMIKFLDTFPNLYCVGRNGQHRYNNMDHSMLTAMETAEAIKTGKKSRKDIWNVNTEKEYHEEKSGN